MFDDSDPFDGISGGSSDGLSELEMVFAEYVERLTAGEAIRVEDVRRDYPHLADDLVDQLRVFDGALGGGTPHRSLGTLGDYVLQRPLGRGGMGVVYEAWENSMDRAVALKVLPAGVAADDKAFSRFMREARTAGKLSHPNVVPVYGVGLKEHTPYFAMEYVEGETLARVLERLREADPESVTTFGRKDDVSYFGSLARIFAEVADGLQHAHGKGVIHRDIKPSNLILDAQQRLRILDFGLARLEGQESLTQSGDFVGTPQYMSPEQARRRRIPIDHRTDIYSLGATMYETFTGEPPFRGKDHADTLSQVITRDARRIRSISPRVPKDLETIVLRCMAKSASDRYRTAEALGQDLRRFSRGDPIEARVPPAWESILRRAWQNRRQLVLSASIVLLAVTSSLLVWNYRSSRELETARRYRSEVEEAVMQLHLGAMALDAWTGETVRAHSETNSSPRQSAERVWRSALLPSEGLLPLEDALKRLGDAIAVDPRRAEAFLHRARGLRLLGRGDAALEDLDEALRLDSGLVPARILRDVELGRSRASLAKTASAWGELWLEAYQASRASDWPVAASAYKRLIDVSKSEGEPFLGADIEFYLGGASALLKSDRLSEAVEMLIAATTIWPDAVEPRLLLGMAYFEKGEPKETARTFGEAFEHQPKFRNEIVTWVTGFYKFHREYEEGLRWIGKSTDASLSFALRTSFNYLLGRYDEAVRVGREGIARFPDNARLHHSLGAALLKVAKSGGGIRDALTIIHRADELNPGRDATLCLLGAAYEMEGDWTRAEDYFERAIAVSPEEPRWIFHLARHFKRRGRFREAVDTYRAAAKIAGGNPRHRSLRLRYELSRLLLARGQFDQAIEVARESVASDPRTSTYRVLAQALAANGSPAEAANSLLAAVELDATDAGAHRELGLLQLRLGESDAGLRSLRRAVELDPSYDRAVADLVWALERLGRYAEAFSTGVDAVLENRARGWLLPRLASLQHRLGRDGRFEAEWDRLGAGLRSHRGDGAAPRSTEPAALAMLAASRLFGRSPNDVSGALASAAAAVDATARSDPSVLSVLGEALRVSGREAEASDVLREALRLPDAPAYLVERLGLERDRAPDRSHGESSSGRHVDVPFRLNSGGAAFEESSGTKWAADQFFHGGKTYARPQLAGDDSDRIALHRSVRQFAGGAHFSGYRIPVKGGRYRVTLHFAEIVLGTREPRRFDVFIEGARSIDDYELESAGFGVPRQREFLVQVEDGSLDIRFVPDRDVAIVSGLEVRSASDGPVE